ncbi:hypothetical protein JZ751_029914 [Albula glossodonta]|uniref:Ras-associating domain-containing protein n=1 Tax=Albula glossodonta TaxID=121402 RepID=A0A8T2NH78_9TELE|nr:hypothetical protein JZ751_029914 [Albula glossodonta]
MELKVWVDGVVRVVCGLSEETSCQDVVIALAQAIGQTGRYVLIQRLRDTERQLLATERPLESLAKLGQLGNEVQFYLRRTGPSSSDGPSQADRSAPLPKFSEPEPPKRREPKKSLTFNLGPSSSPKTKLKHFKKSPRDSPEQRTSPTPPPPVATATNPASAAATAASGPSKEEVFRKVLQQQERLQALETQLESLEQEVRVWEQPPPPDTRLQEELERLEQVARRNEAELALEELLETELREEAEAERGLRRRLGELRSQLDDCGRRLHDFNARSAHLEHEIQQEGRRAPKTRPRGASPAPGGSQDESLGAVKAELQSQQQQGADLEASIAETEKALGQAEALLQAKNEELDELNKELRQCNLQQFIQQAGVVPSQSQFAPVPHGIATPSHSQAVPGEPPKPAEPPGLEPKPRGCVCVRPARLRPLCLPACLLRPQLQT